MIRTRCFGVVGAMIPSRLCCMATALSGAEVDVRR